MEKRLYCVRVVLFVMAENESAARVAATQARFDIFDCVVRRAKYLAPDWSDTLPYNADDERTCSQIIADEQVAIRPAVRSMNLPINLEAGLRSLDIGDRAIELTR